jgi:hypothetical protein
MEGDLRFDIHSCEAKSLKGPVNLYLVAQQILTPIRIPFHLFAGEILLWRE